MANVIPDLPERLREMNDAYSSATDGGQPSDGTYQAIVDRFDFFESKDGTQIFLKTVLKIQHDEAYNGATVETVHNLTDPERIHWVKKHLRILGVECEDLGDLETDLHQALDVPVEISVQAGDRINDFTGLPYLNVYVNERLGPPLRQRTDVPAPDPEQEQLQVDGGQRQPASAIGGADDEDIPF